MADVLIAEVGNTCDGLPADSHHTTCGIAMAYLHPAAALVLLHVESQSDDVEQLVFAGREILLLAVTLPQFSYLIVTQVPHVVGIQVQYGLHHDGLLTCFAVSVCHNL